MTTHLKKHWGFIQLLTTTNIAQRLALLKSITHDQLVVICEIVLNTLQGQLHVPPATINSLKRHKLLFRSLASPQLSQKKKKQIVQSNHKLIAKLLVAVYPLLETYIKQ